MYSKVKKNENAMGKWQKSKQIEQTKVQKNKQLTNYKLKLQNLQNTMKKLRLEKLN